MSNYPVKFGKYLLLERVNVGGMAEVFKAKTFGVAGFERILAIKRILPNLVEDDEFIRMFIDEARIAVQLNHANIVQIYELGKHGDHYYIAMEYVPSRDLRAILDRMRSNGQLMPIAQAAYVTKKVCEGLDYAHKKRDPSGNPMNIIHRDVSPQNILVGFEGEVKVIDFGIAKAANRASKTQAGVLKGKFGYMSPEQVRGLPTDRRSDIFAVGVLLYEMLTGERLFIGESDFSTLERVRNAEVIPPTNFNKKITQELEQIVLKTLAREVEDRFQWASDLAEALEPFLVEDKQVFSMKKLAASLKETYAAEIAVEKQKLEEFLRVTADDAKPERGGPAQSSILPLHAPTDPSASAQTAMRSSEPSEEAPDPVEEEADGFGEDKTFVIEASTAGLALQHQKTEDPPPPPPAPAARPSGPRTLGGSSAASPKAPSPARQTGKVPATEAPSQPGRQSQKPEPQSASAPRIKPSAGPNGPLHSGSGTAAKPPSGKPENTNDDFLEQHSLYGDDGGDDDDSRTLVSAPNPFFEGAKDPKTGEDDDDDEIDASEAEIELPPQPPPHQGARGAGGTQGSGGRAQQRPPLDDLSDAPTQAATKQELDDARAALGRHGHAAATAERSASGSRGRDNGPAPNDSDTRASERSDPRDQRGALAEARTKEASQRMAAAGLPQRVSESTATKTSAPPAHQAARSAGGKAGLDPVAAAMDDEERMALEAIKGSSGGASRANGRAPGPGDVAGGPQLPAPSYQPPTAREVTGELQAPPNTPAEPMDVQGAPAIPPKMMRMMLAAAAGSLLMFIIVVIVGIAKLAGGGGDGATIELFAVGEVKPPDDLVVLIDGKEAGKLGTPLPLPPLPEGKAGIVVQVRGTGIETVTRTIRPTRAAMRQAVELRVASAEPEQKQPAPPREDPPTPAPPEERALAADTRPVAPPVGGGWRLTLATVADETGKPLQGADVYVDNQLYGRTPLEAELDPALDKIVVKVRKDGYVTQEIALGREGRERLGPATVRLKRGQAAANVDPPREQPAPTPPPVEEKAPENPKVAAVATNNNATATAPETPKAEVKKAAPRPMSQIQIGTQPFADTVIDGKKYGTTPFYSARKLELSVGKHRVEFTDKTASKKYRYEINILAPDPDNKVIIVLGKADIAPRVTGKLQVRALP